MAKAGVIVLIILLATLVRLYQVTVPLIWSDEAFSVWLARISLEQMVYHTAADVHPPLYYLALHYWMTVLGDSALIVRGMSVSCGVATVAMGMLLARRVGCWRAAVIAGLLLAMFPIAVRYSQETRMYAMHGLLMMMALYVLSSWARQQRNGYLLAYMLLMITGMYTHYFTVFGAVASWVYVGLVRDDSGRRLIRAKSWWLCNLTIALALAPWLPTVFRQATEPRVLGWIDAPTWMTLPLAMWRAFTLEADWSCAPVLMVILLVSVLLAAGVAVFQDAKPGKPSLLLALYCLVPLLIAWLASYLRPMFMERYLLFALSAIPVLLAVVLSRLSWSRLLPVLGICLMLEGVGLVRLYHHESNLNGGTQWTHSRLDAVMAYVAKHLQPDDALLVGPSALIVDFYNKTGVPLRVYRQAPVGSNERLLYPLSPQLIELHPTMLARRYKRIWWIGEGEVQPVEQQMEQQLIKLETFRLGTSRALLFVAPTSVEGGR